MPTAKYIGRGALAVALGVGVALADGGLRRADGLGVVHVRPIYEQLGLVNS